MATTDSLPEVLAPAATRQRPELTRFVSALTGALGERVLAIVVYGPAARDEDVGDGELNVLVILRDLELATLATAGPAITRFVGRGLPHPRLVTPESLAAAADVFPIELAEIVERHVLVHGRFPHADLPAVDREHLRLQCERELREKLMRLDEAYVAAAGSERALRRLLVSSYPTFAALFRACLRLTQKALPPSSIAAVEAFCVAMGVEASPFVEVDRLRRGLAIDVAIPTLFARYHAAIVRAVNAVDRSNTP